MLYVGRIDPNKGCAELFDYYTQYAQAADQPVDLVLIGTPTMPIPTHPRIRHLGYVTDAEKFSAIAAASLVVVPSYFESLSMAALEAWALGRPVLANGRCDVLAGQCLRSNAGLAYQSATEFIEMAVRLIDDDALADAMGRHGRQYYADHYSWPVIERAYLDMLARLANEPATHSMAPLPNWFARRARALPAAAAVVRAMPSGPVRPAAASRSLVS
jgi:glycosyltransferase involved in cell wall biosynthesis